jgi:signal transduction histidine kinase
VASQQIAAQIIINTARELFSFDSAFIELYDPAQRQLRRILDTAEPSISAEGLIRSPEPVDLEVMQKGARILRMAEAPKQAASPEGALAAPPRVAMYVPFRNTHQAIGIVCVKARPRDENAADDMLSTLESLADYCAGALDRLHAAQALEESERRFLAFMRNTPALAWMKNSRYEYAYVSEPLAALHKTLPGSLVGKTDFDLFPREVAECLRKNDEEVLRLGNTIEVFETAPTRDAASAIYWVFKFPFTDASGETFVGGMGVDVTENKRAEEALRALPLQIMQAQEAERRHVARELHDSVTQVLSSVKFRLSAAEGHLRKQDDRAWRESYQKARELLDTALLQVRQISRKLRPGELDDLGLCAALRETVSEFQLRTKVQATLDCEELDQRPGPAIEVNLFRIFQEALNNIEKYAEATRIEVTIRVRGASLVFTVADNGRGFDPKARNRSPGHGGLGLRHMRERAASMGGSLEIQSIPGKGTVIRIEAPFHAANRIIPKTPDENIALARG